MTLDSKEREELEALRLYRQQHEGKALNRAFGKLEQLLDTAAFDPVISVRAFRIIADCLLTLKEELK